MSTVEPGGEPPTDTLGPTVLRMMLGGQLHRFREAAGVTPDRAGYEIRASRSKISRMENGRVGFKERDVADLLTLYGITDEQVRGSMLSLARQANAPGWWSKYGDVLADWFDAYLGDRKSTRLNSSHVAISYAVFCLKKKKTIRCGIRRKLITVLQSLMLRKMPSRSGSNAPALGSPFFFFFNDTATTEIYTLSLHDALPISDAYLTTWLTIASDGSTSRSGPCRIRDRKSTRLNSSHVAISYAVFCLKKK